MVPAEIFGAYLLRKLVERSGIKAEEIDDVILGNVMGAYLCFASLCLLEADIPINVPGVTLDRNCASGLQAIAFASQAIRAEEADLILEAFAAQALGCYRELGISRDKCNVNGGGMVLGHPIGATGARLTCTLMYEMRRRQIRYGLVTMCVGGGQGTAIIYERI